MTEIKLLTEQEFDKFIVLLKEINEEPLEPKMTERLKEDFALGRYIGFLLYEKYQLAGLAVGVEAYSAVHARRILNLDELYIRESFRRKGLGKILFDHVTEYAKSSGYLRLEWRTEKNNVAAKSLYSQYKTDTDWTYYVMKL